MHSSDFRIVLKTGAVIVAWISRWRPAEGWFDLAGEYGYGPIKLSEVESVVAADGTDMLKRALDEGWSGS